jgi:zinc protease
MMTIRTRTPLVLLLSAITVATGLAAAPQRAVVSGAHDAPLTATVPVDPRITVGTLANGMRYYIRVNEQPKNRAELRLVVNAGSVLEDDDQRGLAHFVEHMAFNGTRATFRSRRIAFPQSTGMHFGAHQRHQLRPDGLRTADSHGQSRRHRSVAAPSRGLGARRVVRAGEIDKERGVIPRNGARARRGRTDPGRQLPVPLKDSRYAARLPIGTPGDHPRLLA